MSELFIHNPYLRGIGVLAIVETILWVQMFRHRKPGVSRIADMLYPNMVSERGQRMKKWSDIASAVFLLWVLLAVVIKASVMWFGSP